MEGRGNRPSDPAPRPKCNYAKHPKRVQLYATLAGVFAVVTGILIRQRTMDPHSLGPGKGVGVMSGFGPCPISMEQQAAQKLLSEKHKERERLAQKETHGILPNDKIAKKLNEWLGPPDPKPTSPPIY
ncbi:hypothetical protein WJX75_007846 [Coccomyxa subellipsoidea]|uniref:Uncharacterized protein n=1 Tax=Coccomyxa subellipsoidea TaxID=248742 RepID=A0ABR2YK33_9CHLO